jgi:hypothetical protein
MASLLALLLAARGSAEAGVLVIISCSSVSHSIK